jgi:hypothetical protein
MMRDMWDIRAGGSMGRGQEWGGRVAREGRYRADLLGYCGLGKRTEIEWRWSWSCIECLPDAHQEWLARFPIRHMNR